MDEQQRRYARLEALEGIGAEGVSRLRDGKVLIVGCGALGSLAAMYLAASGVGRIAIADFDTVDISNLQRQLFFSEDMLGKKKADQLADRMKAINSEVDVKKIPRFITKSLAEEYFADYDFIIDGSDNPATKLMTASVCERLGKPYCIGGVNGFSGQVMSWKPGYPGYAELFGPITACSGFTPCTIAGVLGPAAGVVASVQASEAIKFIASTGKPLWGRLLNFDLSDSAFNVFSS